MYEFIREKEIEKIILEHMINSKAVERQCKSLMKRVYQQTASRILLQVKLYLESQNQYKSLESLYPFLCELKADYIDYLEKCHLDDVESTYSKETLKEVITSIKRSVDDFEEEKENPIIYERMLLISTEILKIKDRLLAMEEDIIKSFSVPKTIHIDYTKLMIEHLLNGWKPVLEDLEQGVHNSLDVIHNHKERKSLRGHIKTLEDNRLMLNNYIYIRFENADKTIDKSLAEELTHQYISPLEKMYKLIDEKLNESQSIMKQTVSDAGLAIKHLDDIIESTLHQDEELKDLVELVELDKNNTTDMVITHVNDELNKVTKSEIKRIKNQSGKFELLSMILVEVFEIGLNNITKLRFDEITDDTERMITKGVSDTLHLKYDSMKEKDEEYHQNKRETYLAVGENFIQFKGEFASQCETFLEEAIGGSNEGFIRASERFKKLVDREKESNLSRDLDYFSRELLFELTTLEDLVNQSGKVLAASENETAHAFGVGLEKLFSSMLHQLQRHDVEIIEPESGDAFNGKMHEVLMTEKEEGYNKGEIIRVQNIGYAYENRILKRAAVIVQK